MSTAGRNRYLLHFNSHHSVTQWAASIRLAMFEQSSLQEAYTGALISGKGRTVNNINLIMDRSRFQTEEWVRVRFGSGVPWRRCWCVISPPNEKDMVKLQKDKKKRSPYDRSQTLLRGDIKFYDTRKDGKKLKKAKPIATLTDAYSAYAIYPQSKALIDASTLVKIEGSITIHSNPPSVTEGFVFIMPEVPPAVTGFEMLLRFLFPTWDTFGLYGRPGRLVASVLDQRSLMFAMPKHRRYGYLDIADVISLVLSEGSSSWTEREWRKRLKELTGQRMAAMDEDSSSGFSSRRTSHRSASHRSNGRLSFGPVGGGSTSSATRPKVGFAGDRESVRSSRSIAPTVRPAARTDSAPPASERQPLPSAMAQAVAIAAGHGRNLSDTRLDGPNSTSVPMANPANATMNGGLSAGYYPSSSPSPPTRGFVSDLSSTPERVSSEDELPAGVHTPPANDLQAMGQRMETPEPVHAPPAFNHSPSSRPSATIKQSAELRRANSRLSHTTLSHIAQAGGGALQDAWPDADIREKRDNGDGSHTSSRSDLAVPVMASGNPQATAEPLVNPTTSLDPSGYVPLGTTRSKSPLTPPQNNLSPVPKFLMNFLAQPAAGGPSQPEPQPEPQRLRTPPPQGNQNGISGLAQLQTSPSILRKPLPPRGDDASRGDYVAELQSADSGLEHMTAYYFNEAAFDQVRYDAQGHSIFRQDTKRSEASSRYDDASSTTSPDYASTLASNDTQESVERPRAGVLRTVGDAPSTESGEHSLQIPEVDFGPTPNYAAQSAQRNKTPTPLSPTGSSTGPSTGMPARKPTRDQLQAYEPSHNRQDSDDTILLRRRSVAWQPVATGAVSPAGSGVGEGRPGALTPEQFVLQRAAQAAASPAYSHQRAASYNSLTAIRVNNTSSPALHKMSSYDKLNSSSGARPSSQGANSALAGRVSSPDVSSHLSAREQEYLARMTGGPLINVTGGHRSQQSGSGAGLVGAIAAREREKQQMKEGVSSQAVQHAINQRHQMQQQQQYMQQQQYYQQQQQQQHQQQQQQQQQEQQAQMYAGGGQQPMYNAYQPPAGHGLAQQRPPLGPQQGSYGQATEQGWAQPAPGSWSMQGQQQGQYMNGGNPQQAYQPYPGQYTAPGPTGMGPPRSGTPGSMGQGVLYPGRAF